jgi:hypothetical protein
MAAPALRDEEFVTDEFEELEELGLTVLDLVGVEGLGGWLGHPDDRWKTVHGRDAILFAAQAIKNEPSLLGLRPTCWASPERPPDGLGCPAGAPWSTAPAREDGARGEPWIHAGPWINAGPKEQLLSS